MKCRCQNCKENIEFESEHAGETVSCPHCQLDTLLFVPQIGGPFNPVFSNSTPKNSFRVGWIFAIGILLALLVATIAGIAIATRNSKLPQVEFSYSGVAFLQDGGIAIEGTIKNITHSTFKNLKISFDIYDKNKIKIGLVSDSIESLPPDQTWKFDTGTHDDEAADYSIDSISSASGVLNFKSAETNNPTT